MKKEALDGVSTNEQKRTQPRRSNGADKSKKYDPKEKDYSYKGSSINFMLSGKDKEENND